MPYVGSHDPLVVVGRADELGECRSRRPHHADDRLIAPSIAVNSGGSITVAFEVSAEDAEAASTVGFRAFGAVISSAATRYASERSLAEAQAAIIAAGRSAAGAVASLRVDRGRDPVSV